MGLSDDGDNLSAPVCVFKKRRGKASASKGRGRISAANRNISKHQRSTNTDNVNSDSESDASNNSSSDSDGGVNVVRVDRKRMRLNVSGTNRDNTRRVKRGGRSRTSNNGVVSDSDDSDDANSDGVAGRTHKDSVVGFAKASRGEMNQDTHATSINTIDGREDGKSKEVNDNMPPAAPTNRGANVSNFIKPGPQKASANIRVTSRFDYQPDVCKDYKETGYCGFGDTCIFMHDRGDYKTGWQLDREWDSGTYGRKQTDNNSSGDESDDEVPFACYICREEFTNPVVTRCEHYFCMKCALDHYQKSKTCYVCGSATNGNFNTAKKVLAKLKLKQAAVQAKEHE